MPWERGAKKKKGHLEEGKRKKKAQSGAGGGGKIRRSNRRGKGSPAPQTSVERIWKAAKERPSFSAKEHRWRFTKKEEVLAKGKSLHAGSGIERGGNKRTVTSLPEINDMRDALRERGGDSTPTKRKTIQKKKRLGEKRRGSFDKGST